MTGLPVGKVPPELLRTLAYAHLGARRADVLVHAALGEDCAAIAFGDEVAVLTTDPITGVGHDLGWYAVFVATNDLAAAGAEPVALMLTLLLKEGNPAGEMAQVMRDAGEAAASLGVEIVGGHPITDLTQQPLGIGVLHLKEHQTLDDDRETDNRDEQEQPHVPAALLHETQKSRKHGFLRLLH